ncbi:DUF1214 domain-containing protein [Alicyclobacillus acidoterrestris]|uniref:DUF1214 domain-containing protein n=1 Tax=Alicyclobacillus acidoterrestris (strain ATCC 49025 / DSM 3922 / CIP 106132 / NCIMB 13137 / GD3B) TaxID=1356854 RepID=T0D7D0_ALIAG|nr:DUF1214 domain-containing protein [Alicyclobacillus acidoterrestris]EPZ45621.1 hypothetical protein N007_08230 [Alicyclobacillus acidoterrestris ATCC 49025]UNO47303.1 DUF1214 domain-containing protein [Alicyclobacillus acidoterrestris]
MTNKKYTLFLIFIGVICVYAAVHSFFFVHSRPVLSDAIQGFFVGFGVAIITAQLVAKIKSTKVNGWTTMYGLGVPSNGMLMRAACTLAFPGPVNIPQEAMYWTTSVDGASHELSGEHDYTMHFPAGGLPPNQAFWSLTMGDAKNRFVANPINRYSVSDRSGLVPNADGSIDIYIQKTAPVGCESNWLPAPSGKFILWFRVYIPGAPILDGKYNVPPVVKVK